MDDDILDQVAAVVVELDAAGTILRIGAHGVARLGFTAQELIGADWFEQLVPREERAAQRREYRAWIEAPTHARSVEAHLLCKDGSRIRVAWRARRVTRGDRVHVVAVGVELGSELATSAEHVRTARALRDVREALDAAAIVAITDRAGIITYVNERFCAVSQYRREELLGQTHRVVSSGLHPPEFFAEMWATISGGEVWRGDVANRAKDGTIYWVATTIVPFLGDDGRPYQYCAIRSEITERKSMEVELVEANRRIREEQANLVQAEKLSSIGVLAAGVAHEINNPLAGVLACVKSLRDQAMVEPRRGEYFSTVLEGLERIQTTVRSLLDYARQRSPSPSAVPVDDIVASVVLLVAPALRKKDIRLVHSGDRGVRLLADRAQLMQALVNVLLNAVFVSPVHGEIRIDVARDEAGATIALVDRGPGFASEVLPRACDPFFTTKPEGEGTGLGLAVTASVVESNGGRLELGNAPEGGARVALWLPAAPAVEVAA